MPVSQGQGLGPGAGKAAAPSHAYRRCSGDAHPTHRQELAQPRKAEPTPTGSDSAPDKETEACSLAPQVCEDGGQVEGQSGGLWAQVKGTQRATYFHFDLLGQHEEKAARLEAVRQGGLSRLEGLFRRCSVR